MPSTADRLATLIADNFDLDHEPNFDSAVSIQKSGR